MSHVASPWVRVTGACECCRGDAWVLKDGTIDGMHATPSRQRTRVRCDLCRQHCNPNQLGECRL